jgi:hypothetical protein
MRRERALHIRNTVMALDSWEADRGDTMVTRLGDLRVVQAYVGGRFRIDLWLDGMHVFVADWSPHDADDEIGFASARPGEWEHLFG